MRRRGGKFNGVGLREAKGKALSAIGHAPMPAKESRTVLWEEPSRT